MTDNTIYELSELEVGSVYGGDFNDRPPPQTPDPIPPEWGDAGPLPPLEPIQLPEPDINFP